MDMCVISYGELQIELRAIFVVIVFNGEWCRCVSYYVVTITIIHWTAFYYLKSENANLKWITGKTKSWMIQYNGGDY